MASHQSVMFVPGTVGCIPGSRCDWGSCNPPGHLIDWGQCNSSVHDQDLLQTAKIKSYFEYALNHPRVAGLCPWHWFDEPRAAFKTEPQYVLGAASFPVLRKQLAQIGSAIIKNNTAKIKTDDTASDFCPRYHLVNAGPDSSIYDPSGPTKVGNTWYMFADGSGFH